MPILDTTPKGLRPFVFHGVDLEVKGSEGLGDCPFCGKENKFTVNCESGLWRCLSCRIKGNPDMKGDRDGGNPETFLWRLHEESTGREQDYGELLRGRGLMEASTLEAWGVCKSIITDEWLIPGYNREGKVGQLYRYVTVGGKLRTLATPGLNHQLFGLNLFGKEKGSVIVCEGPWDAMALWEVMHQVGEVKVKGGVRKLIKVDREGKSLLKDCSIVAVPGCGVFRDDWADLFQGKTVTFLYDNDYPRKNPKTGTLIPPASWEGMRKATMSLITGTPTNSPSNTAPNTSGTSPQEILCLRWGDGDQDHGKAFPDGHDVRDVLKAYKGLNGRMAALSDLMGMIRPVPAEWVQDAVRLKEERTSITPAECRSWPLLVKSWEHALEWNPNLEYALAVMLACGVSTRQVGDQIWLRVIAPPSSGKTTLAEALAVSRRHVKTVGILTGFHSGYKTDKEGREDNSLLASLKDKTLIVKDGDTLLKAPNREQIMAELRDIYDKNSRSSYRNKMGKNYQGLNMTLVVCGTPNIKDLDNNDLGERFLDCVIMRAIDRRQEDAVLAKVVDRAADTRAQQSTTRAESHHDPKLVPAMKLTGGYLDYLRDNAGTLLQAITVPSDARVRCARLGKFTACMRARVSSRGKASRELGSRLAIQLMRLTTNLTIVLQQTEPRDGVMSLIKRVALDTCDEDNLELTAYLFKQGEKGTSLYSACVNNGKSESANLTRIDFLRRIEVLERFHPMSGPGGKSKTHTRWRLSPWFRLLYEQVMRDD